MKRAGRDKGDDLFLRTFGQRVAKVIKEKGYDSPYDFWIKKADNKISRATLNNIIIGKYDSKVTTIRAIAKLLRVNPKVFFEDE